MTDAKGPYFYGLREEFQDEEDLDYCFVYGPGLPYTGFPFVDDDQAEEGCRLANIAYATGRASRDGLREELLCVKGRCNCASTRSIEKALKADGEGK